MATAAEISKPTEDRTRALLKANKLLGRYAELSSDLDKQKKLRKPLEDELVQLRSKLQAWADDPANQAEFSDSQSVSLPLGSIGYRNGVEKIEFNLDNELTEEERTAAIVDALKRYHADGVKVSYDEKQLLKAWPVLPKLRDMLKSIIKGTKREAGFFITLKK